MSEATRYVSHEVARFEKYGGNEKGDLRMFNISNSGAAFELNSWRRISLKPGDLLRITIHLNELRKVRSFTGEVVWFNGSKLGISFVKSDAVLGRLMQNTGS